MPGSRSTSRQASRRGSIFSSASILRAFGICATKVRLREMVAPRLWLPWLRPRLRRRRLRDRVEVDSEDVPDEVSGPSFSSGAAAVAVGGGGPPGGPAAAEPPSITGDIIAENSVGYGCGPGKAAGAASPAAARPRRVRLRARRPITLQAIRRVGAWGASAAGSAGWTLSARKHACRSSPRSNRRAERQRVCDGQARTAP